MQQADPFRRGRAEKARDRWPRVGRDVVELQPEDQARALGDTCRIGLKLS